MSSGPTAPGQRRQRSALSRRRWVLRSVGGEEKGSGALGPCVGGAREERGREEHGETFAGGGELRAANSSRRPELDGDGASA
jgi:hypothetical protein